MMSFAKITESSEVQKEKPVIFNPINWVGQCVPAQFKFPAVTSLKKYTAAMQPAFYKFPDHVAGNTFLGQTLSVKVNGSPLNLTGASISMVIRAASPRGKVIKTLKIGQGISLTYPLIGEFQIDAQRIILDSGLYYYDILFTLPGGRHHTYLCGTWIITPSINPILN